jgi:ABC-2 type transport system ATP-binding protein
VTTDAIVTHDLSKRYRGLLPGKGRPRPALNGLDLRLPAGGITGLLGPNGAGKTTLVRLLLGLSRPTSGSATVLGRDTQRESLAIRRGVAFVPESRSLFGWMRVDHFVAGVAALSSEWDATYAARLLERWTIDQRVRLRELSHGTRSRLLLVTALARRAPLLLLDEPTTGLDPAMVDDALSELTIAAADGATILLVTHRLEEVERICDRVVVLADGRSVLQADLDDLRASWRVVEVAGHPAPDRLRSWEEVGAVMPFGEHVRVLVRSDPDAVVERLRLLGATVVDVRPLTLREIYLSTTTRDIHGHAARDDLA